MTRVAFVGDSMANVNITGDLSHALAQIAAAQGAQVVIMGQSGGQLVDVLSIPTLAELEAGAAWQAVQQLIIDGDGTGNDWPGGLFGSGQTIRALPPPTMTRQQRRHAARKGTGLWSDMSADEVAAIREGYLAPPDPWVALYQQRPEPRPIDHDDDQRRFTARKRRP